MVQSTFIRDGSGQFWYDENYPIIPSLVGFVFLGPLPSMATYIVTTHYTHSSRSGLQGPSIYHDESVPADISHHDIRRSPYFKIVFPAFAPTPVRNQKSLSILRRCIVRTDFG
jgi:hypothetical protein